MISETLIQKRINFYEKAIGMVTGKTKWDPQFAWPWYPGSIPQDPKNVTFWSGCVMELQYLLSHGDVESGNDSNSHKPATSNKKMFPLNSKSENVKIKGYLGLWNVCGTIRLPSGERMFYLENNKHGRAAAGLLVDKNGNVIEGNVEWDTVP